MKKAKWWIKDLEDHYILMANSYIIAIFSSKTVVNLFMEKFKIKIYKYKQFKT